ncbi:methyltransferase domain-containing protein [Paraglaciecola sp.]|uniref:class I SAM-dependent methyltransferase n=1 Tax=Paraglaciecola sp. TaxID=1920173 RepID=UPI003262F5BC
MKKIYLGCGKDRREGYLHGDIRALEGIDIICQAWELSQKEQGFDEIYSRHMFEHLTAMEGEFALKDWFQALKPGGLLHLIVPNMDYHCEQWLKAEWNEVTIKEKWSDARHAFASIFGWQRECNPNQANYNQTYWDVHKSGYNKRRMQYVLERNGYVNIDITIQDDIHLVAKAIRPC